MPGTSSQLEHRRTGILIAALLTATLASACGSAGAAAGPTAESSKSPAQVIHDAAAAIRSLHSFHMSGTITSGSSTLGIDLRVQDPGTIAGSLTYQGATAQILIVDGASYISGQGFFTQFAGAAAGQLIGSRWAELPTTSASGLETGLDSFANTTKFADCLDSSATATKLTKATATYNGASVVAVTGGDTIVEVANAGAPYPMRLSVAGSNGLLVSTATCSPSGTLGSTGTAPAGTLTFDHWGSTFSIVRPTSFIAVPTPAPNPAKTTGAVHYTDPQRRWSATFAGQPKYTATTEASPEGNLPYLYAEYASFDVDQLVAVLLIKPASTFDLTAALNSLATGFSGTVVSYTSGTFRGYKSIEGVISATIGYIKCRIVRAGAVVYIIATVGPVNPPSDYAGFVATVRLTPH
jgi:hypothetical protein